MAYIHQNINMKTMETTNKL